MSRAYLVPGVEDLLEVLSVRVAAPNRLPDLADLVEVDLALEGFLGLFDADELRFLRRRGVGRVLGGDVLFRLQLDRLRLLQVRELAADLLERLRLDRGVAREEDHLLRLLEGVLPLLDRHLRPDRLVVLLVVLQLLLHRVRSRFVDAVLHDLVELLRLAGRYELDSAQVVWSSVGRGPRFHYRRVRRTNRTGNSLELP